MYILGKHLWFNCIVFVRYSGLPKGKEKDELMKQLKNAESNNKALSAQLKEAENAKQNLEKEHQRIKKQLNVRIYALCVCTVRLVFTYLNYLVIFHNIPILTSKYQNA